MLIIYAMKNAFMKTLPFQRDERSDRVTVECADGTVSVHSRCAYCRHCVGVMVRNRLMPAPQREALAGIRKGTTTDDALLNAAMMFNTLVRDGSAIECDDDANEGFRSLYDRRTFR